MPPILVSQLVLQHEDVDEGYLSAYLQAVDSAHPRCSISEEELSELRKKEVPVRRRSNLYKIVRISDGAFIEVREVEATQFIKEELYSLFEKNPDISVDEQISYIRNKYSEIDVLICAICQISQYDLNEYLNGKRYPYIVQALARYFSYERYKEHLIIQKRTRLKLDYKGNLKTINHSDEEVRIYRDEVKIELLQLFLKLYSSNQSISFNELINMIQMLPSFEKYYHLYGYHIFHDIYRGVIPEIIGGPFTTAIARRKVVAETIKKATGIKLSY